MENNEREASLERIQTVFLSEFTKLYLMIKGYMENINLLKKDNKFVKERLEKIENIIETNLLTKESGIKFVCSDEARSSSSLNGLESEHGEYNEYISVLKQTLSVPKFVITLPSNLSTYVQKIQYITEHNSIEHLKFLTRQYNINENIVTELVFEDQISRDLVDTFFKENYEDITKENDYELKSVQYIPKLKVVGLLPETDDCNLIKDIIKRNSWINTSDISLVRTYTLNYNRRSIKNAIINVQNLDVFRRLLSENFIMIYRQKCRVYEYICNDSCLNCLRKGHTKMSCIHSVRCKLCAEKQETRNCKSKIRRCIRCIRFNKEKNGCTVPTEHKSISPVCPSYLKEIEILRTNLEIQIINFQ